MRYVVRNPAGFLAGAEVVDTLTGKTVAVYTGPAAWAAASDEAKTLNGEGSGGA